MNRLTAISSVIMLIVGSVAVAQSAPEAPQGAPPESTPAGQYPDSGNTAQPPSSSQDMPRSSSSNGTTKSATREQLKSCVSEQRTNNPSMSKHDAKKYCETQLSSAPQKQ
ncbi:MAG TPA: hypothetical protein VEY89_07640 [Candidatus Dormibacteraeota bacterium]|nr:hypothetical protein [Candidatus Dormibacteraeota bacterium]